MKKFKTLFLGLIFFIVSSINAFGYNDASSFFTALYYPQAAYFMTDRIGVLDGTNNFRFIFYKFRKRRKIKGNVLVLKSQWHVYYGHWIHEILSRTFLLKDSKLFDEIDTVILSKHCKAKFYLEGLKLFGLDKKKIILVNDEEEIICDNLYFSSFPGISVANPPKWVCDKYLNLTKELLSKNNFNFYDKIYISRKRVKTRNILNEDELINILSPLGYKVIYPEDYSLEEQFCIFNKAKKIISVLGSGLTNLVCCDKESDIINKRGGRHKKQRNTKREVYHEYKLGCKRL